MSTDHKSLNQIIDHRIEKLNKISDEEVRGKAFKIFLSGKKDIKESNDIIEEILSYLKNNNQFNTKNVVLNILFVALASYIRPSYCLFAIYFFLDLLITLKGLSNFLL